MRRAAVIPFIEICGLDMDAPEHYCHSGGDVLHHRPASDPFPDGATERVVHGLTHRQITDGTLTPACVCGWASSSRQHSAFERHVVRAIEGLGGWGIGSTSTAGTDQLTDEQIADMAKGDAS